MYDSADSSMLRHAVRALHRSPRLRRITLQYANETWYRLEAVRLRQAGEYEVEADADGRPARLLACERAPSARFLGVHRGPIRSRCYT